MGGSTGRLNALELRFWGVLAFTGTMGVMNLYLAPFGLPWLILLPVLLVVVFGAALRLARFLTHDPLGEWLIVGPLRRWAAEKEENHRAAKLAVIQDVQERTDVEPLAQKLVAQWVIDLQSEDPLSWQARFASGAECPFCWSFWIGSGLIALTVFLVPLPYVGLAWVLLLAALAMNYTVGHIINRKG